MLSFHTVFILTVCLPVLTLAVSNINDIQTYKPCIPNSTECPDDQVCFKYFCYPKSPSAEEPLRSCKRNSECPGFKPDKTEKCLKQGQNGVCVLADDYETYESHEECKGRGDKLCGDYCCNKEYFQALLDIECKPKDLLCKENKETLESYEPTEKPPTIVPDPSSASYHYGSASVTFSIITTLLLNYQS